jgi:hypothetical protein
MANDTITMTSNHGNPIISQVNINNTLYDIHDDNAIHTLGDLASLGMDVQGAFVFMGTVAKASDLPKTGNKVGYVYHVLDTKSEYVWVKTKDSNGDGTVDTHQWEEFGEHFVVSHIHNIPSLSGTAAAQTWTQKTGTISGTAAAQTWTQGTSSVNILGANSDSAVTGSGTASGIPTITETAKYAKVSTGNSDFVTSYAGATKKLQLETVYPTAGTTSVINSVTAPTASIYGVSGSTTASKATAGTAVAVATVDTAKTVATRASSQTTVGNANVGTAVSVATGVTGGSAAAWGAEVNDGVLSFSFTPNTLQSATTTSITPAATSTTKIYAVGGTTSVTPAKANGSITPYTFADVTVPTAAGTATSVVTSVTTGSTDVATRGTGVGVVTGLTTSGDGATVMTGLGTKNTAKALTSASLVAGTSTDGVHTGDAVTLGTKNVTVNITGTAAAQDWSQTSGTVTIAGTNAASAVSGSATVTGKNAASTVTTNATVTGAPK